jgi:hypothetical protein
MEAMDGARDVLESFDKKNCEIGDARDNPTEHLRTDSLFGVHPKGNRQTEGERIF